MRILHAKMSDIVDNKIRSVIAHSNKLLLLTVLFHTILIKIRKLAYT